jgi:hypothetical protein
LIELCLYLAKDSDPVYTGFYLHDESVFFSIDLEIKQGVGLETLGSPWFNCGNFAFDSCGPFEDIQRLTKFGQKEITVIYWGWVSH